MLHKIKKLFLYKFTSFFYRKGRIEYFRRIHFEYHRGMTYVELIVVLSIFSIVSAFSLFNYQAFEDKVDIKNLSNDIALYFSKAQKSSTSGELPLAIPLVDPWKPSYGIFIDLAEDDKTFYYFTDLNQDKYFDAPLPFICPSEECIQEINITKGNYISNIEVFYQNINDPSTVIDNDLAISFTRPSSTATVVSSDLPVPLPSPISHVVITVSSATSELTSLIRVFTSGRIQLN